jgi:hypothetical protein
LVYCLFFCACEKFSYLNIWYKWLLVSVFLMTSYYMTKAVVPL